MALLRAGPIGSVSGKIGGVEVAQVGGRGVLKQAKFRQSSGSSSRVAAQVLQAAAIRYWDHLTDDDRLRWSIAARSRLVTDRFGTRRALNGFQLFMSMPRGLEMFHKFVFYSVPPPIVYPESFSATCHAVSPSHLDVTIAAGVGYSSWIVQVWIGRMRPKSEARRCYNWKSIGTKGCVVGSNLFNLYLALNNVTLLVGERLAVKMQHWALGYWPCDVDLGTIVVG